MEYWKSIKGYEGIYEISNTGKVKSLQREYENSGSYSGKIKRKEIIIKQNVNRLGYHVVTLSKNGVRKFHIVYRLVAFAFLENPNSFKEVNHKDLNKSNNNVENLEWCDRKYNVNHFYYYSNKSSKYKGVSFQKCRNKWVAYIDINNKRFSLGRFNSEEEANKYRLDFINKLNKQTNEEFI